MSIGIAYNPCKNCKEMDKCSICELTYYRKGCIKSPTADVAEVRHGEWLHSTRTIADKTYHRWQCSVCARIVATVKRDGIVDYPYCHCGAKMDG